MKRIVVGTGMKICIYLHILIQINTGLILKKCSYFSHTHVYWVASVVSDSVCLTLWTVACQAPLSMGFSRQEYWSGLPCPPPGVFLTQESNLPLYVFCIGMQVLYHLHLLGSQLFSHKSSFLLLYCFTCISYICYKCKYGIL